MEGLHQSKSLPPGSNNESRGSLTGARNKCQLCGVASTKAIAGTSGGEDEFTASLEWFHVFLVGLDCLEEGDKRLLNCSAADTCENCKSNLKFAKKHGERSVRQHEKVKRMWEEFTDDLQILQEATGSAMFKLQKALGGPGLSQKELPRAMGNAFEKFTGLQESTQEILSFLSSKFNGNFGLFPVPNIATGRDQQDLQQTEQVTKVKNETGTDGEASDMDENVQNVDPRITCAYSIAGCYVEEGSARNENSFAVKVEDVAYSGSNEADNEIVFLESSKEEGTADNENVSFATGKSKKKASQKDGKARKSARISEKQSRKKRKLSEGAVSDSSEKENSCDTAASASRDTKPVLTLVPQTSAVSETILTPMMPMPSPAIAGPSKLARPSQTSKKLRRTSVRSESSVEDPSESGNEKRQGNRFGKFLWKAGRLQEALEVFKLVEEKERKVKPENKIRIVRAQINVALIYSDMAKDEEALKIWKDAYKTISSMRKRNFELFAKVSYELGGVLLDMKNFTEAWEHLSTDYAKVKEELGDDDCWTLLLLQSLGSAHRGKGTEKKELETALKMHQEAYQGLLEIGGEEDEYTINAKDDLALDLSMLGRHDEALQMFKENISLLENLQRFPERLMEFKLNLVEGLERSGESLEEVLRQLEAIKEEFKNGGWKFSWQTKRVADLINRVQETMQ